MTIENNGNLDLFENGNYATKIIGYFLGLGVLSLTCFIDDIKTIKPLTKLTGQVLAATIVAICGLRITNIDFFSSVELNEMLSILFTIIWIVGITNAINLMDGLDRIIFRDNINLMFIAFINICVK